MTAQPTSRVPWFPVPVRQRPAGFTIEDVLALPPDAPLVGPDFRLLIEDVTP